MNLQGSFIPKSSSDPAVSSPPTALPLCSILLNLPKLFPRSYRDSYRDYKSHQQNPHKFQNGLLQTIRLPNTQDRTSEVVRTIVDDQNNYINEFVIKPKGAKNKDMPDLKHLIFVHGYGAGLGFFFKNFGDSKLQLNDWCIHAIDLPGYGFSSRPKFPFVYPKHNAGDVSQWFMYRVRKWMQRRGLLFAPKSNLMVAHSMGAYLMAQYVDNFPNDMGKILMCSPAGVSQTGVNPNMFRQPPWWFQKLWDRNISPFILVRNAYTLGSKITSGWTYKRFAALNLDSSEFEALHKYTYSIFSQPGSGEYLLSFFLKCGGPPRTSLEESIFNSHTEKFCGVQKSAVDWLWLYGDRDWMDIKAGQRVSETLKNTFLKKSDFEIIPNSGHHLYIENPHAFNLILQREMRSM